MESAIDLFRPFASLREEALALVAAAAIERRVREGEYLLRPGHTARELLGRIGEAEDIGRAFVYLMQQTFATGQVLVVDGGAVLV